MFRVVFAFFSFLTLSAHAEPLRILHPFLGPLGESFETLLKKIPIECENTTLGKDKKLSYEGIHDAVRKNTLSTPQPDIIHVYEMGAKDCESNPNLIPLHEFFEEAARITGEGKSINAQEITPTLRHFYSVNGKLYALPFNSNTVVVYVNKDLWKERPLPTTWEEFENTAKEYKQTHEDQKLIAFGWLHGHLFDQIGAIHGVSLATYNNGTQGSGKMDLTHNFWATWCETLKRFYDAGYLDLTDQAGAEKLFNEGKIPFLAQGTGRLPFIKLDKDKVDVMMLPNVASFARHNSISGGGAFWINAHVITHYKKAKTADEKEAALQKIKQVRDFMMALASPEIQAFWEGQTGYLSILKATPSIAYATPLHEKTASIGKLSRDQQIESPNSVGIKVEKYQDIRAIEQDSLKAYLTNDMTYFKANQTYIPDFNGVSISATQVLKLIQDKSNKAVLGVVQ